MHPSEGAFLFLYKSEITSPIKLEEFEEMGDFYRTFIYLLLTILPRLVRLWILLFLLISYINYGFSRRHYRPQTAQKDWS